MKAITGLILIVAGVALMGYLSIYLMLYGGIMGAINGWGVDTSMAVWGIIRAIFFEFGLIPGIVLVAGGSALLTD